MGSSFHGASRIFEYNLCKMLVAKGIISQQEAAAVFVETSENLREATETDATISKPGADTAAIYENLANLMLGYKDFLPK